MRLKTAIALIGAASLLVPAAVPAQSAVPHRDEIHIVVQNQGADQDDPDVGAFSPDDSKILTVGSGQGDAVLLRDAMTGLVINRIALPASPNDADVVIKTLEFSPDGTGARAEGFYVEDGDQSTCRAVHYAIDLTAMRAAAHFEHDTSDACELSPSFDRLNGLIATSHHGGLRLLDSTPDQGSSGMVVTRADGTVLRYLQKPQGALEAHELRTGALSADGGTVALIAGTRAEHEGTALADFGVYPDGKDGMPPHQHSTIIGFDPVAMTFRGTLALDGYYQDVAWLDADHVLIQRAFGAASRGTARNMHDDRSMFEPPPALVVDMRTMRPGPPIAMHCYLRPLPGGGFVGAGLENCQPGPSNGDRDLAVMPANDPKWRVIAKGLAQGGYIDDIAVSADGTRLAVLTCSSFYETQGKATVHLLAVNGAPLAAPAPVPYRWCATAIRFAANGRSVIATEDTHAWLWSPNSGNGFRVLTRRAAAPLFRIYPAGLDPDAGQPGAPFANLVAQGQVPGKPLVWAASRTDGLRFWDTRNGTEVQSIMLFSGSHFLATTPDGRYDTNLGPDTRAFSWLVADAPERALGPQTFMRTYYTPQLGQKLNACITAWNGCTDALPPIPPPLSLNRVLPQVRIDNVVADARSATAKVTLSLREGVDTDAPNRKTRSGLYNLRLFRDGVLVGEFPANPSEAAGQTDAGWRDANRIPGQVNGRAQAQITIALPGSAAKHRVHLSAYAFNEDRIKSDTATYSFPSPAIPIRPRRAFVLAIGIDAYATPRLRLHYAGNDARLIARRLATLPRQDQVHVVTLDGDQHTITRAAILAALDLLGGGDRAADLAVLSAAGIANAAELVKTGPNDTVIISFSGHGWADPKGNFFLLGADADWPDSTEFPVAASLVSSADLAGLLKRIEARDIALVIDACHSAASVEAPGFKPGPMGDTGLGQLAWDKGIRILAAAGPADVAREDSTIKQGLLTAVLAQQGIDDSGFGLADLNADKRIMLDEWLRYGLQALPARSAATLAQAAAGSGRQIGAFRVLMDSQAAPPVPQQPALFDFARRRSPIALRIKP